LTYDFLDASRKKKYSLISQIFESFVDQGEGKIHQVKFSFANSDLSSYSI
jgi:hypothetical protein